NNNRTQQTVGMDTSGTSLVILLITEFFMVFFLALGYLVRYRGRLDLLRGHNLAAVSDRAGLARFVGGNLLALGILAGFIFLCEISSPPLASFFFFCYLAVILVVSFITARGSRRFEGSAK
ncbi:MAG: hypothetical protein LUQ25_08325, partial [Methanoregulaceae archaeon]|nr:hypothetical protein [Methanoregulaceae archaeon]